MNNAPFMDIDTIKLPLNPLNGNIQKSNTSPHEKTFGFVYLYIMMYNPYHDIVPLSQSQPVNTQKPTAMTQNPADKYVVLGTVVSSLGHPQMAFGLSIIQQQWSG